MAPIEITTTPVEDESAATARATRAGEPDDGSLVVDDLLVEDVSIDGMCGVY